MRESSVENPLWYRACQYVQWVDQGSKQSDGTAVDRTIHSKYLWSVFLATDRSDLISSPPKYLQSSRSRVSRTLSRLCTVQPNQPTKHSNNQARHRSIPENQPAQLSPARPSIQTKQIPKPISSTHPFLHQTNALEIFPLFIPQESHTNSLPVPRPRGLLTSSARTPLHSLPRLGFRPTVLGLGLAVP